MSTTTNNQFGRRNLNKIHRRAFGRG